MTTHAVVTQVDRAESTTSVTATNPAPHNSVVEPNSGDHVHTAGSRATTKIKGITRKERKKLTLLNHDTPTFGFTGSNISLVRGYAGGMSGMMGYRQ